MRIKLNGEYITDGDGNPLDFETALLHNNTDIDLLDTNGNSITKLVGFFPSAYTLEGGDWTKATEKPEQSDMDDMFLEFITTGTVTDTSKERLCARQIHDNKMEYPSGIPAGISVKNVYDAYTYHYRFFPPIEEPTE